MIVPFPNPQQQSPDKDNKDTTDEKDITDDVNQQEKENNKTNITYEGIVTSVELSNGNAIIKLSGDFYYKDVITVTYGPEGADYWFDINWYYYDGYTIICELPTDTYIYIEHLIYNKDEPGLDNGPTGLIYIDTTKESHDA